MGLFPEYRQALFMPFDWQRDSDVIVEPLMLTWHLRGDVLTGKAPYRYTCMNALAQNLPPEDCSTPEFESRAGELPKYVTDYMNRFARTWMAAASWGRAKFSKPCPEIPL